jgi:hypothetical protein
MHLHQRGIDLAADHVDSLTREDIRQILEETSVVLGRLLERDIPVASRSTLHNLRGNRPY